MGVPKMYVCPLQLPLCLGKSQQSSVPKEWLLGNSPATAHPIRHDDVEEANTEGVASVCGLWSWKHKRNGGGSAEIWTCMKPEDSLWRILTMKVCVDGLQACRGIIWFFFLKKKYAVFLDGVGFFLHSGYMFTFISNFVKADFPTGNLPSERL